MSHPGDKHGYEVIQVRILWGDEHEENEILADITPEELLDQLGGKFSIRPDRRKDCFIKVIGEDSYLLGDYRIIDFEYIRERVAAELVRKRNFLNSKVPWTLIISFHF